MCDVLRGRADSRVPLTMEAAVIDDFGPPSVLRMARSIPVPQVGASEVLIGLRAAGVGVWDLMMRDGSWQPLQDAKRPLILGTDGAGIVVQTGVAIDGLAVGDRVYAYGYGGFYAQYVAVDAAFAGKMPAHLDFAEAAAASATGLTTLQGLYDVLKLSVGEKVLIMGASGAMGTLAIQFAKQCGARVIGSASGEDARRLVAGLGADEVFDARSAGGMAKVKEFASGGLDAAFVLGAGAGLEDYLDLVREGGRIAFPHGVTPPPRDRSGVMVTGYDLTTAPSDLERMTRLSTEIGLRVPIAAVYSLAEAAKVHQRLGEGHVRGRIVLVPRHRE